MGGLKTNKIFADLLQYFDQAVSRHSNGNLLDPSGLNPQFVPAGSNRTLQPTDISGALTKPGDSIGMSEIPNEDSFMMGDSIF